MRFSYPQQTVGSTLVHARMGEDERRVYARMQKGVLEVGEFTQGPLSSACYGGPAHVHCVHLDEQSCGLATQAFKEFLGGPQRLGIEGLLALYFLDGARTLDELMDWLDARGVPYGYMAIAVGAHVSYRPPNMVKKGVAPSVA